MSDWTPTHFWHSKRVFPERRGQRCRVLARSTGFGNSALVEFVDGFKTVTSQINARPL